VDSELYTGYDRLGFSPLDLLVVTMTLLLDRWIYFYSSWVILVDNDAGPDMSLHPLSLIEWIRYNYCVDRLNGWAIIQSSLALMVTLEKGFHATCSLATPASQSTNAATIDIWLWPVSQHTYVWYFFAYEFPDYYLVINVIGFKTSLSHVLYVHCGSLLISLWMPT